MIMFWVIVGYIAAMIIAMATTNDDLVLAVFGVALGIGILTMVLYLVIPNVVYILAPMSMDLPEDEKEITHHGNTTG